MNWIFLLLCIVFALPIMWAHMQAKDKKPVNIKRKTLIISVLLSLAFLILYVIASIPLPSSNSSSQETRTSQTQSSNKESENSSSEEADDGDITSAEAKKVNKQLVKDLEDDQNDAIKGDQNYNWAPYILKIKLNKNKQAYIWVDGKFLNLSDDEKQFVAKKANGLVGRSIVTAGVDYSPEESREGIYMAFYNGSHAIGHSRFTDHTSVKWYK